MIQKSVLLPCDKAQAFALFTEEISVWWPPERRHTKDADSRIVLAEDGPFFEESSDGERAQLGRVKLWDPPHRLELDWYPGTGPDAPTRVAVTFVEEDHGTRVRVEHGPLPVSEQLYPTRADKYAASWDLVLAALDAHVTRSGGSPR